MGDLLISFGVGAGVCLVISACAVLASFCTNFKGKDDKLPPFKVRLKWAGWLSFFAFTCPISVPVGYIVLIIVLVRKKKKLIAEETSETYKIEE